MKRFEEGRLNSEVCGIVSILGRDSVFNITVDLIFNSIKLN
jgi:hypothetical protein